MAGSMVGFRANLYVNDGASQAYVQFDDLVTVTLPSRKIEPKDSTCLNQSSVYKTYLSGILIEPGQLKFKLRFTEANLERMETLLGKVLQTSSVATNFKIMSPDPDGAGSIFGKTITFDGWVSEIGETEFSREDLVEFEVSVQPTGVWTVADSAQGSGTP